MKTKLVKTKNYKKIIVTLFSLTIIFLIVYGFLNKNNLFSAKLYADITNSNNGYTCDRYSGICYVDKYTSEYNTENDCLNKCPDFRFKWYCNKTLGQCTRDFRGTYNNLETCWKNCYDKISYYCDILTGHCLSGPIGNWGNSYQHKFIDNKDGLICDSITGLCFKGKIEDSNSSNWPYGIFTNPNNLTIEECTKNCRPITTSYVLDKATQKCRWVYFGATPTSAIPWTACPKSNEAKVKYTKQPIVRDIVSAGINMNTSDIISLLGFDPTLLMLPNNNQNKPMVCVPSPTGEYENYKDCFETLQNGFDSFKNYSGYNCDYQQGKCILAKTNAEFQATTLEDAMYNCKYNCNPELDKIIKEDYAHRVENKNGQPIANPKEHACFNYLNEKGDACYSNSNCTIQNNICANNHANDPASGWLDELTCKNNGWYWLGSYKDYPYKQLCICQNGKCSATAPAIGAYCGNHICEEWEKYKYIHGNGSISTRVNRYYCLSDCP